MVVRLYLTPDIACNARLAKCRHLKYLPGSKEGKHTENLSVNVCVIEVEKILFYIYWREVNEIFYSFAHFFSRLPYLEANCMLLI